MKKKLLEGLMSQKKKESTYEPSQSLNAFDTSEKYEHQLGDSSPENQLSLREIDAITRDVESSVHE